MNAFDYLRAVATADRLIKRFGQSATLRQVDTAGGDPWDPGSGTATTTDTAVSAAVLDYTSAEVDGTLILATDRKVYVAANGIAVTPTPADALVIEGTTHTIITVKPLSPAGTVVFWEVQARAA